MSTPDPARNEIRDAIAVSPTGKAALDHDKLNPKLASFTSPNMQRGATEIPNDKNYTPSTGVKRENKDPMDNLHMKLIDNTSTTSRLATHASSCASTRRHARTRT